MYSKGANIISFIRRFNSTLAIGMLCIFISLFAVQASHRHTEAFDASVTYHADSDTDDVSVDKLQLKCDICDYLLHKQSKQLYPPHQPRLVVYTAPVIPSITPYTAGISKLSFFSWTNKGPPQA